MAHLPAFAVWLRSARKSRGLTQARLSDLIGVEQETVSAWERGRAEPLTTKLLPLARALGMSASEMEGIAKQHLRRSLSLKEITVPAVVRERLSRPNQDTGTKQEWPKSAHLLASRLETRILEAGGDREGAQWARRALINPDAYLLFYPSDQPPRPEAEVLAQMDFMAEGLFIAATGKRSNAPDKGRSNRKADRG